MTDANPLQRTYVLMRDALQTIEKIMAEPDPLLPPVHNNRKKLSKRDVVVIRSMKRNGVSQKDIADAFDVHHATISRICRGIYHK